jgi:hypothetical protein
MAVFPADEVVVGDEGGGPPEVAVRPADEAVFAETVMVTDVAMLTIPGDDDAVTLTMSANEAITEADVMAVFTVLGDDAVPGDEDTAHKAVSG